MSYVTCAFCGQTSNVLPPHGDQPCPHRLAVLEAERDYWRRMADALDRTDEPTLVPWPSRDTIPDA